MIGKFLRRKSVEPKASSAPGSRKPALALDPDEAISTRFLDEKVRGFAEAFFERFRQTLPSQIMLLPDLDAPECSGAMDAHPQKLSLCFQGRSQKLGTARVELRGNHFFTKIVTRDVPGDFLHQNRVQEMIKNRYAEVPIRNSRSRSGNGFTLSCNKFIITLEVFVNGNGGNLAADQMLNGNNETLAVERMHRFIDLYGAVYNLYPDRFINFKRPH